MNGGRMPPIMEESGTYTGSAVREIAVGQEADAD
jgi:hypothetical protein